MSANSEPAISDPREPIRRSSMPAIWPTTMIAIVDGNRNRPAIVTEAPKP